MKLSRSSLAVAITLVAGGAGGIEPAAAIVPDGQYRMVINDTPYVGGSTNGGFDIGSDGNWNSSFTFGCLPQSKGCGSQAMYDNGSGPRGVVVHPSGSQFGSDIPNDGVAGVIDITVSGGNFTVNSFSKDVTLNTAGGAFFQIPPDSGTSGMAGTISGTAMTLDLSGRLGSIDTPIMLNRAWNIDDCGVSGCPAPNGNTSYDLLSTATATNSTGTVTGTPISNIGDIDGDGIDDFSATLVSGGFMGSAWGDPGPGFFGAQYFEIWNVSLLSKTVLPPTTATISISIPGQRSRECTEYFGSLISVSAQSTVSEDDAIDTISWSLEDGVPVASGETVDIQVPLGIHTIAARLDTILGDSATTGAIVFVRDTINPVINAAFLDGKTGAEITTISASDKAVVTYSATDDCDPAPAINATAGVPAQNGDTVKARMSMKESGTNVSVQGDADTVELTVTAEDASGNMASSKAELEITR